MQKIFDVHVFEVQRLMSAVLPYFRNQGKGTILHTSSFLGGIITPFLAAYSTSKYALESLAQDPPARIIELRYRIVHYRTRWILNTHHQTRQQKQFTDLKQKMK